MFKKIVLLFILSLNLNILKPEGNINQDLTQTNTTNFVNQNGNSDQNILDSETLEQLELINQQEDLTFKDKVDLFVSFLQIKLDRIKKHVKRNKKEYICATILTATAIGTLIYYLNKN